MQKSFNPVDYRFRWIPDWYEWDSDGAHKDARRARDAEAKRLRAAGCPVRVSAMSGQLITRGGIGSGHPEISHVVTVYRLDAAF